jgi:hypothetical protein
MSAMVRPISKKQKAEVPLSGIWLVGNLMFRDVRKQRSTSSRSLDQPRSAGKLQRVH